MNATETGFNNLIAEGVDSSDKQDQIMQDSLIRHFILYTCTLLLAFSFPSSAQTVTDRKLEDAVSTLRNSNLASLPEEQRAVKGEQLDEAWQFLRGSGNVGLERLKQEIQKIESKKEKDDFFMLSASALLWQIGKSAESKNIARIWNSTPLSAHYNYVFYTAMEAAQTQEATVLPMLKAVLKDDKGGVVFPMHAMSVGWPLSHEFVWGTYGPAGLLVLAEILETSKDEVEIRSAMVLVARAQYLPSLPRIRQLASSEKENVRRYAIQSLGIFGHPDDYDFLVSGLRSTDTKELWSYVFALYEFDDLRSVPLLIPVLEKNDDALSVETFVTLLHLLTPESLAAASRYADKGTNTEMKEFFQRELSFIKHLLPADFEKRPASEQAKLVATVRNKGLEFSPDDPPFTNKQLLEAAKIWKEKGAVYESGYDPGHDSVRGMDTTISMRSNTPRMLIFAAKPENIDLLLETKASFYKRLSDECLYEVRDFDKAIKYIARSRYRKGIGITERAELR